MLVLETGVVELDQGKTAGAVNGKLEKFVEDRETSHRP